MAKAKGDPLNEWTTRLYRTGDEARIRALYERVFALPTSDDGWRWRYLDNPTGRVEIRLAEGEDHVLAGQYAVMPVFMKAGADDITGALSLDTMVHQDFQGQGMFTILANELYECIARHGVPIVYGFPNSQSHRGFVKHLGWVDLCETLPIYVHPLNYDRLVKKVTGSSLLAQIGAHLTKTGFQALFPRRQGIMALQIETITTLDERFDALWQAANTVAPILVRRDRAYLQWRYLNHPSVRYRLYRATQGDDLIGYAAMTYRELAGLDAAFIVDLLVRPDHPAAATMLISELTRQAEADDRDLINCLMFPHISYVQSLRQAGFIRAPAQVFPQELHLGARNNGNRYDDAFVHTAANWYITWADHDTV